MLTITIPGAELFNEKTFEFVYTKPTTITLEHSLVSISKWESKWHKPFISKELKTKQETIDYIKCMTITQNVDPNAYFGINDTIINQVNKYIDDPMTATWFSEDKNSKKNTEVITSELIYYWMIALNIPFECQRWHLNRLLTLIRVCSIKSNPNKKKMSKNEIFKNNRALNEARKKALGTTG